MKGSCGALFSSLFLPVVVGRHGRRRPGGGHRPSVFSQGFVDVGRSAGGSKAPGKRHDNGIDFNQRMVKRQRRPGVGQPAVVSQGRDLDSRLRFASSDAPLHMDNITVNASGDTSSPMSPTGAQPFLRGITDD